MLQLHNGTIQYRTVDGQFSDISFVRYDMALERLTGDADSGERRADRQKERKRANFLHR